MYNATTTTNLAYSLRRAIVPAGATAQTKRQLARLLLDLADELGQTGGMDRTPEQRNNGTAERGEGAVKTVSEVLDAWRPQKMLSCAPLYVKQVESLVRELVGFITLPREVYLAASTRELTEHLKVATLAGISGAGIVSYIAHVREHGRPLRDGFHKVPRPSSDKTCNDSIASLRTFFAEVMRIGGSGVTVGGHPCEDVQWVGGKRRGGGRRGRKPRRGATAAEARAIIAAAPLQWSEWYRGIAEVGMRAGGFEKLRPSHLDFSDMSDPKVRPYEDAGGPPISRKGLPEVISVSVEFAQMVQQRTARMGLLKGGTVFGRRPKREQFFRHVEAAGVAVVDERGRTLGMHGFRRFMATELASQGVAIKVIQDRMGHADVQTTLRYFDHLTAEHDAACEKLQGVLDSGGVVVGSQQRRPQDHGASLARATGSGAPKIQVPKGRGFAKPAPYLLAAERSEWALQGSNDRAGSAGVGGLQVNELQETVCRLVGMILSGVEPGRVAMVLRAVADALLAESAAVATVPLGADGVSASGLGSISPPAPSAAPIAQAG